MRIRNIMNNIIRFISQCHDNIFSFLLICIILIGSFSLYVFAIAFPVLVGVYSSLWLFKYLS